jgi:hypothetical protein
MAASVHNEDILFDTVKFVMLLPTFERMSAYLPYFWKYILHNIKVVSYSLQEELYETRQTRPLVRDGKWGDRKHDYVEKTER